MPTTELAEISDTQLARVRRAIRDRKRYRYVNPKVRLEDGGMSITSPCCSRKLDPNGGVVSIAFVHKLRAGLWRVYRLDHAEMTWRVHSTHESLGRLLDLLNEDPDRLFWQ